MWHITQMETDSNADFTDAAAELLQSTSRKLIFITGAVLLLYYFLAAALWPVESQIADSVAVMIVFSCAMAWWLVSKNFLLAAQVVWQVGLAIIIVMAIFEFQQASIAFFLALLPLMAVVTMGWWAGVLAEAILIGAVWWIASSPIMPPMPGWYGVLVALAGIYTGLLGWAITHTLLSVTQWSLINFQEAQQKTDEAREQRMELKQIQDDLLIANRELARLSDRLRVLNHTAEEARRAKEEFVANVSHEFRTPLNMIISFSEMITQSPQIYGRRLPAALLADITAIQRNSRHLSRLVDDVLDLSQLEAGRMTLSKETVPPELIIEAATETVRALFESKGLYLNTELSPHLPPLFCDRRRVQQIMVNLLSNAGRYTDSGGVTVKAWADSRQVVISVSDTGSGIAEEDQERIFEPFQQLDGSLRRRHGGSGLGLSISKRFVEMHNGKMWLESDVGVGTIFYISLPSDEPIPEPQQINTKVRWINPYEQYEERAHPVKVAAPELVPRYVLLESGNTLQKLFRRYSDKVELDPVKNIDEVIDAVNGSPAQAVVVNVPSLGEELDKMNQLGSLPYGTPTIMCWVPGEEEVAEQMGVVRYLVKPIPPKVLLETLEQVDRPIKSVLIVDDNPEILQLFSRILSNTEHDYQILQAADGDQAIAILRKRQPDIMLLDLFMTGKSGYQVLQEKQEDPSIRDIPVVMISARDPVEGPLVSDQLIVTRSGGLSVPDILNCIQNISEILAPSG